MGKEYIEALKSYDKIDNTLCLNNNRNNIEFAISEDENLDCKNAYEMVECLDNIKQALVKEQENEKKNAKYKQLEKQLGCPLEVIGKALKDGIFCEDEKGYVINLRVYLQFVEANAKYSLLDFNYYFILPLEDYKKTWWLKEDRSE